MNLCITINLIFNLLFTNIVPSNDVRHIIRNETDMQYLNEIVKEGLLELGIGNVRVDIRHMNKRTKWIVESRTEQILDAYIKGNNSRYVIYIARFPKSKSTEIISHELIHLKQYYEKSLKITYDSVMYNGKLYRNPRYIDYRDRPWEQEAYLDGKKLKVLIKNRMEL